MNLEASHALGEPALPCDQCGGPGWIFGGEYGLMACADCNDAGNEPRPLAMFAQRPTRQPEPWSKDRCEQCSQEVRVVVLGPLAGWFLCHCLAAAETAGGTVVLKFPQPVSDAG